MSARPQRKILVFDTPEQIAKAAAERFVVHGQESIREHNSFSVALAGGNTPRRTYELLATDPFRSRVDWRKVHFFFGDERTVPHDHPDSNYRLAHDALISHLPIQPEQVHPICGVGDPAENARNYERELKWFFSDVKLARFDLVLLGMGKDGHTASLFPGTDALNERRAWVVANRVEALGTTRITLTAPAINAAARIEFLVTGADKSEALAAVLNGPYDPHRFPAQLIKPTSGSLTWLLDSEAASALGPGVAGTPAEHLLASHVAKDPKDEDKNKNG